MQPDGVGRSPHPESSPIVKDLSIAWIIQEMSLLDSGF